MASQLKVKILSDQNKYSPSAANRNHRIFIMALLEDLQKPVTSLESFKRITIRTLNYLPEVTSSVTQNKGYTIIHSTQASTKKYSRPFRTNLFIQDPKIFDKKFEHFLHILSKAADKRNVFEEEDYLVVDTVTYTIQQSISISLDLLGNQNANRKHVGNRFEELIKLMVSTIGIANKKIVLKIPYEDKGIYSCETDFIFSPYKAVKSDSTRIEENEIVVSLKTSSKDRMGKIFIDKILMSRFVNRDVKVIGIFLNDVQRKEKDKVGCTFVAGLFMVYTKFLTNLDGIYFVDPPPHAKKIPYSRYIKRFSKFLLQDARNLLDAST